MQAAILIILYCLAVVSPQLFAGSSILWTDENFFFEVGKGFALTVFMILMLQPLLAARFKWMERPFGFDILIRFHQKMVLIGVLLIIAHPLLLSTGEHGIALLIGLDQPWFIWVGKGALFVLLLNIFLSGFLLPRGIIKFETWRLWHNILGPLLLLLIFMHSFFAGKDLKINFMQFYWVVMLALAVAVFVFHRLIRPAVLGRQPYRVTEVKEEAPEVWTVKLAPAAGGKLFSFLPGQFQFITFKRRQDLPVEEHHWTISSSPMEDGYVSSTIKALGDFTSTIGETRTGDEAVVHAPFGRFSYLLHPGEEKLIFIAGGIGVTPLMSMLRHMRDNREAKEIVFLYANDDEKDIVFREELESIAGQDAPRLRLVHVLSHPAEGWQGERGHIDAAMIRKYCGANLEKAGFYVCGPPGLVNATLNALKEMAVPDRQIHTEIFSFIG